MCKHDPLGQSLNPLAACQRNIYTRKLLSVVHRRKLANVYAIFKVRRNKQPARSLMGITRTLFNIAKFLGRLTCQCMAQREEWHTLLGEIQHYAGPITTPGILHSVTGVDGN